MRICIVLCSKYKTNTVILTKGGEAVKVLKLMAFMIVLSLVFTCLISSPAVAGENPWDADGDGNIETGTFSDSTYSSGNDVIAFRTSALDPNPGCMDGLWFDITYQFSSWVMSFIVDQPVVDRGDSGKTSNNGKSGMIR